LGADRRSETESSSDTDGDTDEDDGGVDGSGFYPSPTGLWKGNVVPKSHLLIAGDEMPLIRTVEKPAVISKVFKCFSLDCSNSSRLWEEERKFWNHIKGEHADDDARALMVL
jgi:hypothetical protein